LRDGGDPLRVFDIEASGSRIPAMEGLRAYAVLLTFSVHFFGAFMLQFRGVDPQFARPLELPRTTDAVLLWLQVSPYGVYLFFILSGFLIGRMVGNARRFSYPRFLWRRALRIYPAFLIALALGVLVFAFIAGWAPFSWPDLGANLLFLNGMRVLRVVPYLHQTWSLWNEMVFYIVFPVLLLARPLGVWSSPWRMLVAGAALVYAPFLLGYGQAVFILFFAGAAAARCDDAALAAFARRVPAALVVVVYLAVTNAISCRLVGDHLGIWLYAAAGTLFMIVACYGDGPLTRLFAWRPVRRLGNISYSLFLTHTIPIFFVVNVLGTYWPGPRGPHGLAPAFVLAILALAVAVVLAAILFLVAERPYFRARIGHGRVVDGSIGPRGLALAAPGAPAKSAGPAAPPATAAAAASAPPGAAPAAPATSGPP
jgi:peptidoglycan/LPS O-acetylase OafA/YrhL